MSRRVRSRSLVTLSFLLLSVALGVSAAAAQDLDRTVEELAAAWHRGDASGIATIGASGGVSLDVDGGAVGPLGPRQAAAVLRRVFDDRESIAVRTKMMRRVGGEPARAFTELTWHTRARGTTIPEEAKLFVAFVEEDGRWSVTEIRLLR